MEKRSAKKDGKRARSESERAMSVQYRLFKKADIPAIVALVTEINEREGKSAKLAAERIAHLAAAPHLRAEDNFTVAATEDGQIVAGSMHLLNAEGGLAVADIQAHPDWRDREMIDELVRRFEARVSDRLREELPGTDGILGLIGVAEEKRWLASALKDRGYQEARRQYVMRIALDKPIEPAAFPAGHQLQPFDRQRDGRAVHAAYQACFADHYGGVGDTPYERWAYQFEAPEFDASLWHILMAGGEIVGICLCDISGQEEGLGHVEALGVLPRARGRGLGGALLRHAFHDFQRRGFKNCVLEVDRDNASPALSLYERAGMRVESCVIYYGKPLRASQATTA